MKKSPAAPSPPRHLSAAAKKWWRALMDEYAIDDPAGLLMLQSGLEAFDRMKDAQATIEKEGTTMTDRFDQKKAHPLLVVERDARSQMLACLKGLNLDLEPLRDRPGSGRGR